MNLSKIIADLRREHDRIQAQHDRIEAALRALERVGEIDPEPRKESPRRVRRLKPRAVASAVVKQKACKKCGVEKPLDDFSKNKLCSDGHIGECKECERKRRAAERQRKAIDAPEDLTCKLCHSPCSTAEKYRDHMSKVHGKAA